jgi:hypothetical protein
MVSRKAAAARRIYRAVGVVISRPCRASRRCHRGAAQTFTSLFSLVRA